MLNWQVWFAYLQVCRSLETSNTLRNPAIWKNNFSGKVTRSENSWEGEVSCNIAVLRFFWATVDLLIQAWPLELTEVKCLSGLYVPVNVNHGPPTPGTVSYSVTFRLLPRPLGESGLLLSPPLVPQSARSGGPCLLGGSGGMLPRKFCDCFCWMRARLACLLSLLTHNVDRYLIYQKLYLFWEFTRVKIGVSNIKVTVGCDGRRLILKTFNLLWWRPPQCVPWRSW